MEDLVSLDSYTNGINYQLLGHEKQTLQVVLMPGQKINTKLQAILYTSENLQKSDPPSVCCKSLCTRIKSQAPLIDVQLQNDTSTVGYVGLQLMKGKIIVIDNELEETKDLVVK